MPEGLVIVFWYWWIAALVFIGLEVFAPGFVFIWMGISAGIVGGLLFMAPDMGWQYQFILWAVLSLGTVIAWRTYRKNKPAPDAQPGLNQRGAALVGERLTLESAIENGKGHALLAGGRWTLKADEDLPAGCKVKVISAEGMTLVVERQ
ncbi:NfeD family protein [Rhodovibrionaceae bacterium A322]